jgi:hypothetical protein
MINEEVDYQGAVERIGAVTGYSAQTESYGKGGKSTLIRVDVPAGATTRQILLFDRDVDRFCRLPLEHLRLSGEYNALMHSDSGLIEVALEYTHSISGRESDQYMRVWDISGAKQSSEGSLALQVKESSLYDCPSGWMLSVEDEQGTQIQISPVSQAWADFFGDFSLGPVSVTLKVRHAAGAKGPRVDDLLDGVVHDFLFELDYKYAVDLRLERRPGARSAKVKRDLSTSEVHYPGLSYSKEALALFTYGAGAAGFPLLQFLSYYQVLEYFFPIFSTEQVISRVRNHLKDPTWDPFNDRQLTRLIALTAPAHRGNLSERQQLQLTIERCMSVDQLREFLQSDDMLRSHFERKQQVISGVKRLDTSATDLAEHVAGRIYDLRCRIVHTKDSRGVDELELLLPTGPETRALGPEIELVRRIAQAALVHAGKPRL